MRNRNLLYFSGFFGNFFFERGIWILYLTSLHYSLFLIGILQSVLNLAMFLAEVPTGIICDKIGRKKSLLLGHSLIVVYLAMFLMFHDFWILLLAHVLYGVGLTFISGTDHAFLYDSLKIKGKESLYGKSIGTYNGLVIIGLAVAMAAGGYLQDISWSYVFIAGIVTQLIAIGVITQLKEIQFKENDNHMQSVGSIFLEIKDFFRLNRAFKYLILSVSIFFSITSVFYMYGQDLLNQEGIPVRDISIIFAGLSLLQAMFSFISSKPAEKYTAKRVLIATFCIIGILYCFIPLNNTYITVGAFILINALYDIIDPVSSKVINDEIPSKTRATILSIISLMTSFIMFIAFPFIGFLSDYFDNVVLLTIIGLLSIVLSLIMLISYYKQKADVSVHQEKVEL
ncbi:MFS transporter [Bacillus changyiensis]|uniref:MFS transporter n=1 Tax=Bacillus changyiensis TaxID=3004103 RepID=UPI0022E346E5|nr:MFS transporter [Bacillus changyiensis]MDA1476983.1 MFS transporter [Bacillus changyiensis]